MRIVALAILTAAVPLLAQSKPVAPPKPAKQSLEQQVDRAFRGCSREGYPGAVVLIARGDEVLLQKGYGLADLERNVPLSPNSVLDIGSTSKQFTAACVLLLEQEGDLSLDDPIRKHIAELPACVQPVTLRHMMLHTSGLPDYISLLMDSGEHVENRTTMDDALLSLADVDALLFPVGTQWSYSNSNYMLLSEVVERVSGLPLPVFAEQNIFKPLGMKQTHIHRECTQLVPNRALSYSRGLKGGWRWNFSNWEQTGDGAVFTTVGDLLLWSRNFHDGKVGGQKLLAAMAQPGKLDNGTALDYGAGLEFGELAGLKTVRHSGAWAAYRADLLRIPSKELTVVCLCNRDDVNPIAYVDRMAKIALAADAGHGIGGLRK
ncbi:MAG: CubicO group peptidase (beta-lactamase class C family) [Planctomycetota bacterium]|jgi:CubicO group peptidase (beta-lactamase class C family)